LEHDKEKENTYKEKKRYLLSEKKKKGNAATTPRKNNDMKIAGEKGKNPLSQPYGKAGAGCLHG